MTRRTLIVGAAPLAGAERFYHRLVCAAPRVIAADAGAALCRAADRVPDACVGDFDSIDASTMAWLDEAGVPLHRHPVDKDASDLDLAIDLARDTGATAVDITAAFSGRIDHTLAALGALARTLDLAPRALEPDFTGHVIGEGGRRVLDLEEAPGTTISLFALDSDVRVSTAGLRYPLDAAALPQYTSLGLSNRAEAPRQRVEALRGRVLVLVSRDESNDERSVLPDHPGR